MNKLNWSDEGIDLLVKKIIKTAENDWKHFAKLINKNPNNKLAIHELEKLIEFFDGNYFVLLNGSRGDYLVEDLLKLIDDGDAKSILIEYNLKVKRELGLLGNKENSKEIKNGR